MQAQIRKIRLAAAQREMDELKALLLAADAAGRMADAAQLRAACRETSKRIDALRMIDTIVC